MRNSILLAIFASLALLSCGKSAKDVAMPIDRSVPVVAPPAGKEWSEVVARTQEGGYRMGNPDAPISWPC